MLLILTGKTASGKDTILGRLLRKYPNLRKVVTTTSRKPRQGEKIDLDYHFITRDEFQQKKDRGEFIEFVDYGGKLYGTTKTELADLGKIDLIWRIDPSRAANIRELITENVLADRPIVIYVSASDDVIIQRLKKRGLPPKEIKKRMKQDAKDWDQYKSSYDHVVENPPGKLEETIKEIIQIIEAHKRKIP